MAAASPAQRSADPPLALHQIVEAFDQNGWCQGVVSGYADERGEYQVSFPASREVVRLRPGNIRPIEPAPIADNPLYNEGAVVEVSRNRYLLGGSWYPATVLKVIGAMYFLVKYDNWPSVGDSYSEILDSKYLRPCPDSSHHLNIDEMVKGDNFVVEAFCAGGWSRGIFSKVLSDGHSYIIKMNGKNAEHPLLRKFDAQHLRPCFEWVGGEWKRVCQSPFINNASQSALLVKSTNSKSSVRSRLKIVKRRAKKHQSRPYVIQNKSRVTMEMPDCSTPILCRTNMQVEITSKDGGYDSSGEAKSPVHASKLCSDGSSGTPLKQSPVLQQDDMPIEAPVIESPVPQQDDMPIEAPAIQSPVAEQHDMPIEASATEAPVIEAPVIEAPIESTSPKHYPFEKNAFLWKELRAMEVFKRLPQQPHFRQELQNWPESHHEGVAFGLMMAFASCADKIEKLQADDVMTVFEEKKKCLDILRANGFSVQPLMLHLRGLIKSHEAKSKGKTKLLGDKILELESENLNINVLTLVLEQELEAVGTKLDAASLQRLSNKAEVAELKREFDEVRLQRDEAQRLLSTLDVTAFVDEVHALKGLRNAGQK